MKIRKSSERGHASHGWLDSYHTFSFANYYDPRWMGFRALRVLNEDRVAPGSGFGPHPHQDMEILTWVISGAIAHEDSLGNEAIVRAGELQRMTAGTGVVHSERNASSTELLHFLQIWVLPERNDLAPSYEQKAFPVGERLGRFRAIAARDGRDGSLSLHQDAVFWSAVLPAQGSAEHELAPGRHAWLHLVKGSARVNGELMHAGDGIAATGPEQIRATAETLAEILLIELS